MDVDAAIFGGGAAGLWLLDVLAARGLRAVLLERDRLGAGQTICAQGIIHGGLKYTLDGVVSGSAEAIRDMPDHWRDCLADRRLPSLAGVRVRADFCYLWRTESLRSRLGMIGARLGLRTAVRPVAGGDRPAVLADCPGHVATVAEPVIDPASLLSVLAGRHRDDLLRFDDVTFRLAGPGHVESIELSAGGRTATIAPGAVVLTAGAGNAVLAARLGLEQTIHQQARPLHMLMMRGALPELNGHCVDGARTRVTITSDADGAGRTVWQVGGQIAEDGVPMAPAALQRHGAAEITAVLPGLSLDGVEWATYRIDRAEADAGGHRPTDFGLAAAGNVIAAWPTKLALVPRLAQHVAARLGEARATAGRGAGPALPDWPRPEVAQPPWETARRWTTAT